MITTTHVRNDYTGNGTTNVYNFTFKIFARSDLLVIVTDPDGVETTLTVDVDYLVTGVGLDAGGTITIQDLDQTYVNTSGYLLTDYTIALVRNTPFTQPSDIKNQGDYYPELHEDALDRVVMQTQQINEELTRVLRAPASEPSTDLELPTVDGRAGTYLAFDASGNPIAASVPTGTTITTAYIETLLDDANAAAARTTLGFTGAGGTAAAANLDTDSVITAKIQDQAVTTAKISDQGVTVAKIDTSLIFDLTTATLASDDYIPYSDTSDSGNNKKFLVSNFRNPATRSVITTDTATTADEVMFFSGASFTQTLFTAVGNSGKILEFVHDGTSLTQVYTIDGFGAETIGGAATILMYTAGERYRIISDGANWKILDHVANTDWSDDETVVIGGSTAAPGISGTVFVNSIRWRRAGRNAHICFAYKHTAATTTGTGDYIIPMPTGLVIDSSEHFFDSTVWGAGVVQAVAMYGSAYAATTVNGQGMVVLNTVNNFKLALSTVSADGAWGSTFFAMSGATLIAGADFVVPITGWKA